MGPATRKRSICSKWRSAGVVLLPPEGRLSLIHVDDLGRLLLALTDPGCPDRLMVEPDDGRHTRLEP